MSAVPPIRIALMLAAAFTLVSALALAGVLPRGPLGDWETPLWADVLLAPFSAVAVLGFGALLAIGAMSERLGDETLRLATRLCCALVVASAIEVVLKAAFPSSAGGLGAVAFGPLEMGFYPSGHTLRATILTVAVIALAPLPRLLAPVLGLVPVAVGAMLVAAGGHYPIDVVGGLLLGAAAASIALTPAREREPA